MTAEWSCTAWRSRDELLALHAVRLAGFADTQAIADRIGRPVDIVSDTLSILQGHQFIGRMTFADSSGWILTESGKIRDDELLQAELEESGARPVLEATLEEFESTVNHRLVRTVTQWQLHPSPEDDVPEVVRELAELDHALRELMAELAGRLSRFGRYSHQFSRALENACAGDHQWIAGVGRLSCHVVWAELHEDLLSSLGRDRSAEPRQAGP